MSSLATDSCAAYRSVVYKNPKFISYFKHATPEAELGNLNIGGSGLFVVGPRHWWVRLG